MSDIIAAPSPERYQEQGDISKEYYAPSPDYNDEDVEWTYVQDIPSVVDPVKWYFRGFGRMALNYIISIFPILTWIYRYNWKWLYGDVVAGITVGVVVVPQSMSYAQVAGLEPQYGLYTGFFGVMVYCLFATSKDVSIGPVAVMSAETYKVTNRVMEKLDLGEDKRAAIASLLSLLCGVITLGMGLLRLGFLLEYIPMPAIMGFMTGSAFTIAVGQIPGLMGYKKKMSTRGASYEVVINTLKHLPDTNINAAFGLVSLFVLYFMKFVCGYLEKKDKKRKWIWFYLNSMRTALVIIFSTLISWGVYRIYGKEANIQMIGHIPPGIHPKVNKIDREWASALGSELPISVVILVLEHIAISRSFGRVHEYRVNPNQELIAIGVANVFGFFFQAYPNTGSFSRTALKSKCGVRTPLAGVLTGACVIVAIYALTEAFYFISKAALCAVIIHAVGDLIASWQTTYKFFRVSPVEFIIFIADIFICVFVSLEAGLYFSFAACFVYTLLKQTFPKGEFLGKVEFVTPLANPPYVPVENPHHIPKFALRGLESARQYSNKLTSKLNRKSNPKGTVEDVEKTVSGDASFDSTNKNKHRAPHAQSFDASQSTSSEQPEDVVGEGNVYDNFEDTVMPDGSGEPNDIGYTRPVATHRVTTKWWPLSHRNVNPEIKIVPPPPGIYVYRFRESLTYQNAAWQTDRIIEYIRKHTKRNLDISFYQNQNLGDRPWNEIGPRKYVPPQEEDTRPVLRAIVFDMSASPNVDMTGAQVLWDAHQELQKYACVPVEFHFAGLLSPWARRTLLESGFGRASDAHTPQTSHLVELAKRKDDPEAHPDEPTTKVVVRNGTGGYVPVVDTNTCFFHFDIPDLELREF